MNRPGASTTWTDLCATLAPSVVSVASDAQSGAGWVALANGVIVTSARTTMYQAEVRVEVDDGRRVGARVLATLAAAGVALVLPTEALARRSIPKAPPGSVRVGDSVLCIGRPVGQPVAVRPATICETERAVRGVRHLVVDATLDVALGGGPVVDSAGRAIGTSLPGSDLVLPIEALAADLRSLDVPPAQLADRAPMVRCPGCSESLSVEHDRCLVCGAELPASYEADLRLASAERTVKELLSTLGIVANKVRTGDRAWRVRLKAGGATPAQLHVSIDPTGALLCISCPVTRVPSRGFEAFYRAALTLNDGATGVFRLGLRADTIVLTLVEPAHRLRERDVAALVHDLVKHADHWRKRLHEAFGAEPVLG